MRRRVRGLTQYSSSPRLISFIKLSHKLLDTLEVLGGTLLKKIAPETMEAQLKRFPVRGKFAAAEASLYRHQRVCNFQIDVGPLLQILGDGPSGYHHGVGRPEFGLEQIVRPVDG
jgi:hypothetical protein